MLKIIKNGFSSMLMDSEVQYLSYLYRIIEKFDKDALVKIDKKDNYCHISILPENKDIRRDLISDLVIAHDAIGLEVELSKSIKISNYISFIVK